MSLRRILLGTIVVGLFTTALVTRRSVAQDAPDGSGPLGGFPDLIGGLKATEGCLGVETARTSGGKNVIFAWFEDKKAVLRWYHSDTHQGVMKQFFADGAYGAPMKDVADDGGPIMAIASITLAEGERFKETNLPISQIAIELYRPLAGGIYLGSRFAPDGVKVPGLKHLGSRRPGR